mgnify:CR=1 FL=1
MEVTVVFSGIGAGVDAHSQSPEEYEPAKSIEDSRALVESFWDELDSAQRPAMAIVERWVDRLPLRGVRVLSVGRRRVQPEEPLHWEIGLAFLAPQEETAKRLAIELAMELGIAIKDCRDQEGELTWVDVVTSSPE